MTALKASSNQVSVVLLMFTPKPGSDWHESHQIAVEIVGEDNITYMEV